MSTNNFSWIPRKVSNIKKGNFISSFLSTRPYLIGKVEKNADGTINLKYIDGNNKLRLYRENVSPDEKVDILVHSYTENAVDKNDFKNYRMYI